MKPIVSFQCLEENICAFVKTELEKIRRAALSSDVLCDLGSQGEDEEAEQWSSRRAFLQITLQFLRSMKQEQLADSLLHSKMSLCHHGTHSLFWLLTVQM